MNIPCPINAPCQDDSNPVQNLSAEAPDAPAFYAYGSGPGSVLPGRSTGPGSVGPAPGQTFSQGCSSPDGPIVCTSTISQAEADLCVQRQGQECNPTPTNPTPDSPQTPTGGQLFGNTLQSCTVLCPDGSPFTFQVAPGLFVAATQELADREANSYACTNANALKVCFTNLSNAKACLNEFYSGSIVVTGGVGITATITAGSPPPGVNLSVSGNTITLSGTPTAAGNFTFTVKAMNSRGNFMAKSYNISVLGITNANPLPDAQDGTAYSEQLTASGGTGPYSFAVVSGAFPAGLAMDTTGLITGSPVNVEVGTATVVVTDSTGQVCSGDYSITASGSTFGFKICNWPNALAQMAPVGGCDPSAFPAWSGLFDQTSPLTWTPGAVIWYFLNKSISSQKAAANETPGWPDINAAFDNCFTYMDYSPLNGTWELVIGCANDCTVSGLWIGTMTNNNPNDPSGTYTSLLVAPDKITVVPASHSDCCQSAGPTPPATVADAQGLPQPSRIRIQNYASVIAQFGACATCQNATTQPLWDGSLPNVLSNPVNLLWRTLSGGLIAPEQALGKILQDPTLLSTVDSLSCGYIGFNFFGYAPPTWGLNLFCLNNSNQRVALWQGIKTVGADPTGVYVRVDTNGLAVGPDCITMESY